MHAGGVLRDASLPNQTLSGIREVMAAKVHALQIAQRHPFATQIKNTFVFSSTASLLGPAGQANYAAANASLDAISSAKQSEGRPCLKSPKSSFDQTQDKESL